MFAFIWAKFSTYILAAGAIITAIAGFYLKARNDGVNSERLKTHVKRSEDNKTALETSHKVSAATDSTVDNELLKFARDK